MHEITSERTRNLLPPPKWHTDEQPRGTRVDGDVVCRVVKELGPSIPERGMALSITFDDGPKPHSHSRIRMYSFFVYSYCLYSDFVVRKPVQLVNFALASSVPTPFELFCETKRSPEIEVYSYFS